MIRQSVVFLAAAIACLACAGVSPAASTAITYQGRLGSAGQPAGGQFDMEFRLYPTAASMAQIGDAVTIQDVEVEEGLFTVTLDFHAPYDANDRWISIGVRPGAEAGAFTPLAPRQQLRAAPQAQFALNAPFLTNGSDVYYTGGNIGIGTNTPIARLHVNGGAGIRVDLESDFAFAAGVYALLDTDNVGQYASAVTGKVHANDASNGVGVHGWHTGGGTGVKGQSDNGIGVHGLVHTEEGFAGYFEGGTSYFQTAVGIGTTTPAFRLHVNGLAGKPGGGSWSVASDERLKTNIEPIAHALDQLLSIKGVTFEYRDPAAVTELPGRQTGVIAQQIEKTFPQWVDEGPDGYKRVTFRGFEAMTVEAVRELKARNDVLRNELDSLREQLRRLESRLVGQTSAK